jgi:hypothetical protein
MKTTRCMGLAMMSVLMVGLLAILVPTGSGQAPAVNPGILWEYTTYRPSVAVAPPKDLNELGQQGWELVGLSTSDQRHETLYVFKRPHRP